MARPTRRRTMRAARRNAIVLCLLIASGCARSRPEGPYRFVTGERLSYALQYDSTSASDFGAVFAKAGGQAPSVPSPLKQSFVTTVRAAMTVTVLGRDGDDVTAAVRFAEAEVALKVNGLNAESDAARIAADLGRPVFARISRRGRVGTVLSDPALGTTSRGYVSSLLAAVQCVFPDDWSPSTGAWTVEEDGPNGTAVAHYRRTGPGETPKAADALITLVKSKEKYLPAPKKAFSKTREVATAIQPKGEVEAVFDTAKGRLASLDGTETEGFTVNGQPVGSARNEIHLAYRGTDRPSAGEMTALSDAERSMAAVAAPVPLSTDFARENLEAASYQQDLGDATLDSLLADLKAAEETGGPRFDTTPLYLKFRALIFLHPETCAALGDVLSRARTDGPAMKVLTTALNAIGHPEGQSALADAVLKRSSDEKALFKLLFALSTVERPTPEAEQALRTLMEENPDPNVVVMARLSLGSMARRLAVTAPERATAIIEKFCDGLAAARTFEAKKSYLLALGNAGSAAALPAVRPFVGDANPDLRAAAVRSLRFVTSSEAESVILRALSSDPEFEVRMQAVDALADRDMTPEAFAAEKGAFLNDASVRVRLALMKNLWKARSRFGEVRSLVEGAAANDRAKEVREAAGALLKSD
jgi:HEAT repeat protein